VYRENLGGVLNANICPQESTGRTSGGTGRTLKALGGPGGVSNSNICPQQTTAMSLRCTGSTWGVSNANFCPQDSTRRDWEDPVGSLIPPAVPKRALGGCQERLGRLEGVFNAWGQLGVPQRGLGCAEGLGRGPEGTSAGRHELCLFGGRRSRVRATQNQDFC